MRIPHKVKSRALSYVEAGQLPKPQLAPVVPTIIGYLPHPDVPEVFAFELSQDARISSAIATTPDAAGYAVTVTHEAGWGLVRWTDLTTGKMDVRLWYAGGIPKGTRELIRGAYQVKPCDVKALIEHLSLPERLVKAALSAVGPQHAVTSLELLEWLSEETTCKTWAEFRNEVSWLWYWCQHGEQGFTELMASNPVISPLSPDMRVVMYGAKCAALA